MATTTSSSAAAVTIAAGGIKVGVRALVVGEATILSSSLSTLPPCPISFTTAAAAEAFESASSFVLLTSSVGGKVVVAVSLSTPTTTSALLSFELALVVLEHSFDFVSVEGSLEDAAATLLSADET